VKPGFHILWLDFCSQVEILSTEISVHSKKLTAPWQSPFAESAGGTGDSNEINFLSRLFDLE